jgi:stearoyl-CoA desaturase (delta-9 desaturase)
MSRFWQFVFAVIANSSAQRGALWWAANHRHHHLFADKPEDIHSPVQRGFLWSHVLWILTPKFFATNKKLVKSWMKFPELVFLNRFSTLVPLILLLVLLLCGELLRIYVPSTGTSGAQMVVWGFCISTVALFHATATINSLDHMIGRRRYNTPDRSRNNWLLAILTFGEGWHNNHHHYPISTRQGFFWWELDITYYVLVFLSWLGIVHDLTPLPEKKRTSNLISGIRAGSTPL